VGTRGLGKFPLPRRVRVSVIPTSSGSGPGHSSYQPIDACSLEGSKRRSLNLGGLKARVIRTTAEGVAVEFVEMSNTEQTFPGGRRAVGWALPAILTGRQHPLSRRL
jgi:hypothetical protein